MNFHKKRLVSLLCVSICSVSLLCVGHADTPAQRKSRREIAATYDKMARAMLHKDLATIAAIEAPDYQITTYSGATRNRERDLAMTRFVFSSGAGFSKVENKIVSLTWRGPDAIVISQSTIAAVMRRGKQSGRADGVILSRDYWSKGPQGWQIRQSVERESKAWINGHRVQ